MIEVKNKSTILKKGHLGEEDNKLFHEGKNYNSYRFMGAHYIIENRKRGVRFTTWAPNAAEIYIAGDFNNFNVEEEYKLERITSQGIWSIFILGLKPECKYKFYIVNKNNNAGKFKSDPYGYKSEICPSTASIVKEDIKFKWSDRKWINKRNKINVYESPINIYEINLVDWKTKESKFRNGGQDNLLNYDELAKELSKYILEMGYTHVKIIPLLEEQSDSSCVYKCDGYYYQSNRYGSAEDFKNLINELHTSGIGVILDWIPGHFCIDEHGLYMLDGSLTYEYEEEWKANNKGGKTYNFDLGRAEVKSFLISNAMYWIKEFHIDGLSVHSVSNIIYLNYGKEDGEWIPNECREDWNLEGIDLLRELNTAIYQESKGIIMIAEESTYWPNICKPIEWGGLGFNLKLNIKWMNDTLKYIEIDPIYRKYEHNKIKLEMMSSYSEKLILTIPNNRVIHRRKALVNNIWGDCWNKFAGLRLYMAYIIGNQGKKLTFMDSEFIAWQKYKELEWKHDIEHEMYSKTKEYIKELNRFYINNKALWELDYYASAFEWIDADNNEQSIISFIRKSNVKTETLLFICNFTPIVHYDFRIGVPYMGEYKEIFNSDNSRFGGSGQVVDDLLISEDINYNGQKYSLKTKVPPMGVAIIAIEKIYETKLINDISMKVIG